MSVTDLLKAELPVQSSALIMHTAAGAFSKEEPNEDMACLETHLIPPKAWLEQLEKNFVVEVRKNAFFEARFGDPNKFGFFGGLMGHPNKI